MNITDIDPKFRIPLVGEYNASVLTCPECRTMPDSLLPHTIGFAEYRGDVVKIIECPECFTKWYFHARDIDTYRYFQRWVAWGLNKHYDKSTMEGVK